METQTHVGKRRDDLLEVARQVMDEESRAIATGGGRLGEAFVRAVELIDQCRGKVVVTGLGKSGIAAKKIAATFASTGIPALFLHAAEAGHGDLGVAAPGDVAIALSYSGETRELVELIPRLKLIGVPIIALTGGKDSTLAQLADCLLDVSVPARPWPFGLIPTASNALTVAIGDALAIALVIKRGVKESDFATFHPGGMLGRKLLVSVSDLMHTGAELPVVSPQARFHQVLMEMTGKRLGVACVVDEAGRLAGIFTDGDLRRLLEQHPNPMELSASAIAVLNPKATTPDALAAEALRKMEHHQITCLPVVDPEGKLVGLVHMHDILKLETTK